MDCDQTREWLSAQLDDESSSASDQAVSRHLATCPTCRQWADSASRLHRQTSVRLATSVPDLSEPILAATSRDRRLTDMASMARLGLAVVAAVQLLTALAVMWAADPGVSVHIARELGSWNLALAVGFAVAAFRPIRARGMLTLLAVVVGCLCATSLLDMIQGYADPRGEMVHVLEIAGVGLVFVLARPPRPDSPPPAPRLRLA